MQAASVQTGVFYSSVCLYPAGLSQRHLFDLFYKCDLFPNSLPVWDRGAEITAVLLGQTLPETNPVRQTVSAYLNLAGIEAGYSYFAPNIPENYKIVFELHYRDGRTEIELPE